MRLFDKFLVLSLVGMVSLLPALVFSAAAAAGIQPFGNTLGALVGVAAFGMFACDVLSHK